VQCLEPSGELHMRLGGEGHLGGGQGRGGCGSSNVKTYPFHSSWKSWSFRPVVIMWGVFSNSNELVALFDYPQRGEADAYAAQLTDEWKLTFYVTQVRQVKK